MKILLTGGLGYIGSHVAVELLNGGHEVVVVDNLSNSKIEVKGKIEQLTGKKLKLFVFDMLDEKKLRKVFKKCNIEAVIHFAGLKAVGESVSQPVRYYENNLESTLNLLKCMDEFGVKKLVFSSSATVYGEKNKAPYDETMDTSATNPYGRTKLFIEEILKDLCHTDKDLHCVILRYFNPVGAHESGIIGEDPIGTPNNLVPAIARVATGKAEVLTIYGNGNTKDGTGIRDYIHVCDLAEGHVAALNIIDKVEGYDIINLGTGKGISVLEMVNEYNNVCGNKVKYVVADRRPGDVDECYADCSKAKKVLNWTAKRGIKEMCESSYNFEKRK